MIVKVVFVVLPSFFCICIARDNTSGQVEDTAALRNVNPSVTFHAKGRERRIRGTTLRLLVKREATVANASNKSASNGSKTAEDDEDFEVVTEEERRAADQAILKDTLTYAGYTLLAALAFIIVTVCFVTDPRTCIIAFGSGSPCCMLCPCYRNLMQYTDPAKLIKANINLYVPGVYIEKSGQMRQYPPSPEEMECLYDLVSEFMTLE